MRCRAVLILVGLTASGCSGVPEEAQVVGEIIGSSLLTFVRCALGTMLVFGLLGMAVAVAAQLILRKVGGYRWDWAPAKWFRLVTLIMMLVALPVLFGSIGFFEGLYRGGARALTTGRLAEDVYPIVGQGGADAVAAIYLVADELAGSGAPLSSVQFARTELDRFKDGGWELDVEELVARLESFDTALLERLLVPVRQEVDGRYPALSEGIGRMLLNVLFDRLVPGLVHSAVREATDRSGAREPSVALIDGLRLEAAASGDPRTVSHRNLSLYLVRALVVEPLLHLLRPYVRVNELPLFLLVGAVIGLPIVFFRTAHAIQRKRQRAREA